MTEFLLAVSNSPACKESVREKLRKHASWMIGALTWVPDDEESVKFVSRFGMTDMLFEVAADARRRGCSEVAHDIEDVLASWTFESGRVRTGWGTLGAGLVALAALSAGAEADAARLRAKVAEQLAEASAPPKELLDQAARELVERAGRLPRDGVFVSPIDRAITQVDQDKLRQLLLEISRLLSPQPA